MTPSTALRPALITLAAAAVLLATVSGCGSDSAPADTAPADDRVDPEAMAEVAQDAEPSVEQIVGSGSAVDADYAADGSALVIYQVVGGGAGDKHSAWRLYDPDGEPVAEGRGGRAAENSVDGGVLGLDDGFLLVAGQQNLLVGLDGSTVEVPAARQRLAVEPGDLHYRGRGGSLFRPQEPMIFVPAPRNPEGELRGWSLDSESGRRWLQTGEPEAIWRSAEDDERWERIREVELQEGEHLLPGGITVVDDKLAVSVAEPVPGAEEARVTAVAVRRLGGLPTGPWRYLDGGPLAEGEWSAAPTVFAADEATLVISDWERGTYRLDIGSGEWQQVSHPTEAERWEIEPGRGGLFAFHGERGAARFSDDWGATWSLLPR